MKLILKEAFDEDIDTSETFQSDVVSINDPEFNIDTLLKDDTIPDQVAFIDSDELNELRDILYNLDANIHLLLLNNDCIIIVKETEDNISYVYCLTEDASDFDFIELPNKLTDIMANNNIIKYLPDQTYENHEKVVSLFKKDLPEDYSVEEENVENLEYDSDEEIDDENIDSIENIEDVESMEDIPDEGDEDVKGKN